MRILLRDPAVVNPAELAIGLKHLRGRHPRPAVRFGIKDPARQRRFEGVALVGRLRLFAVGREEEEDVAVRHREVEDDVPREGVLVAARDVTVEGVGGAEPVLRGGCVSGER